MKDILQQDRDEVNDNWATVRQLTADSIIIDEQLAAVRRVMSVHNGSIMTPCELNGQPLYGLVDSGATISVVNRKFCEKHGLVIKPNKIKLSAAFADAAQQAGITQGVIRNGGKTIEVELAVADLQDDDLIIGLDLFSTLGFTVTGVPYAWPGQRADEEEELLTLDERNELRLQLTDDAITPEERAKVMGEWQRLIEQNQRIPENAYCTHPRAVLRVETGQANPVFVQQYPIPKALHSSVTQRVEEWVKKGWVRRCQNSDWSFPLLAVPKRDGEGGMTA